MPTSMDHSKYRYENFEGRPNVWIGYHIGTPAKTPRLNPLVLEVARKMFTRAPRNTYIFTGPSSHDNPVAHMYRCTVERDDEVLGFFFATSGRKGNAVQVDNDRIRYERERGGGMVTSDAKRAASLALKKFLPTSNEEVLLKQYAKMNEALRNLAGDASNRKRNAMETAKDAVLAYVQNNWATEGQALLAKVGVPPSDLKAMGDTLAASAVYDTLRARYSEGLTFVIQKGDTLYAVPLKLTSSAGPDLHQRAFNEDDAPAEMKFKVSALKLTEPGSYVPDFGMKLGETSFAIFFDLTEFDEVGDDASEGEDDDEEDE